MSRSLRSNTRWKKLQVQQIKQVDNKLRININKCTATSIDSLEQEEFLSLYGLIPNKQQNGKTKVLQRSVERPIENIVRQPLERQPSTDDDSNNNNRLQSKRKITLGKGKNG